VVREFLKKGCKVAVHDPYIKEDDLLPPAVLLTTNLNSVVEKASLVFISSDHKLYSKLNGKSFIKSRKPLLIFDGRNILSKKNFKNAFLMTIGMR
jgi:UDP-N-acetyl-D-mannosaminuronate dehydrogenase